MVVQLTQLAAVGSPCFTDLRTLLLVLVLADLFTDEIEKEYAYHVVEQEYE